MALREAILVCLTQRPLSGYDLTKEFQSSIGFFWKADHQQVYRELRKLLENNWVNVEEVAQSGRPDKKVYRITEAGREHLWQWSQTSTPPPSVKDNMMVKLYALAAVDPAAVRAEIRQRLPHHQERLELYRRIEATRYTDATDSTDPDVVGRYLGLQLGIAYESAWISWCDQALELLGRL